MDRAKGKILTELEPGTVVKYYKVVSKLGSGSFGAVYQVIDPDGGMFAMKTEKVSEKAQVFKMEVEVLKRMRAEGLIRHVCEIVGRGREPLFQFVVMTLTGKSLLMLRKERLQQKFSLATAYRIGRQCLEALWDLHNIGFLHREVKPGNFAIGRKYTPKANVVFVLDFGLSRRFKHKTGELRTPRISAGFRGTVRYAPVSCHIHEDLGRKDDLESWFYQQVEFTKGKVPWRDLLEKNEVKEAKEKSRVSGELVAHCPDFYATILKYIDGLRYVDEPDYEYILKLFALAMRRDKILETEPYDWDDAD